VASKQLQPVYDKPMIYYPLATLIQAGISEVRLISTPHDLPRFGDLLGDGSRWGMDISYTAQPEPGGIAQAFLLADQFIGDEPVTLILGDNIFYGEIGLEQEVRGFAAGAVIFGYPVRDPERYGVIVLDGDGNALSLEEKPAKPKSKYAVPGLYVYDGEVVAMTRTLSPSARGELEITDLNRLYLDRGTLRVRLLDRGVAWLDSGTHDSLLEAANFIATVEHRQSIKIACLEETAFRAGLIDRSALAALTEEMPRSSYREYLETVLDEG
jgi:glucose-1-phosphate thymidylyltransferase